MAEKIRVYALARLLQADSERILSLCRQAGIHVMNSLSSLDESQQKTIQTLIGRKPPPDDGGETIGSLVPVWRPPPHLADRKKSTQS